jgi:DNA mismatch repair protein MutS2
VDEKSLILLEYPKILNKLAQYCAFSVSSERARQLQPATDLEQAQARQALTSEAVRLLATRPDLTIGGARDIRAALDLANHGGVLLPTDLLDIKSTLIAYRTLGRMFERLMEQFPLLSGIALRAAPPAGMIEAISRALSERGEILDSASEKLGKIRRDMRIAYERLMGKLQRIAGDPKNAPYLQEALITQRDGRYVLPLRSEFKGRIKSIVHDQSSSGATLFVEPLSVVELNNEFRELQLAERDEERRILAELSDLVGRHYAVLQECLGAVAELDLVFACAKYSDDLKATPPTLLPIQPAGRPRHPGSAIRLYQARHPLLDPASVVPIDVEFDDQTYALVITGPNTGGKTVTLKTVGLLALMAQSGLHIPAHSGSQISLFKNIYADIGDEQSIEQSLSTFSGHITNIIRILQNANTYALVILDELGAGTDPQEGAALARALLNHLLDRRITTLVTTHHPELKAYAHATPGVVNASVEFDLESLQPTFHLTIGLPGRSNALAIAQRLGMPGEIIRAARQELDPSDVRAEDLLDEIHRQRDLARQARAAADKARQQAEKLRGELVQRLEQIEDERRGIMEQARAEAEEKVSELEDEIRLARRQLSRARQPVEALLPAEEQLAELQEAVTAPVRRRSLQAPGESPARRVSLGDKVRIRGLNMQGVVSSLTEEEAEVQVGMLRVRARLAELELEGAGFQANAPSLRRHTKKTDPTKSSPSANLPASPGIELDLRGQRADEALDALERYLDSAYLASLPFVRIIHGKGTGKLRETVRQALAANPHVASFESGGDKEGGEGVTVARLRS